MTLQVSFGVIINICFSGRRSAYNWLTGSNVDTLADYSLSSDTLSSLLVFEKKRSERPQAAWRAVGAGFGANRLTAANDETDSRSAGETPYKYIWFK